MVNRNSFYLKVWKFEDDPTIVAHQLGFTPDRILRKGDGGSSRVNGLIFESNPRPETDELPPHWEDVLARISGGHHQIAALADRADVVFTLWIADFKTRPILVFPVHMMRTIAECGARLEIDYP